MLSDLSVLNPRIEPVQGERPHAESQSNTGEAEMESTAQ